MNQNINDFGFGVPAIDILVENKALDQGIRDGLQELVVQDELNMPTMFCIKTSIFHDMQLESDGAPRLQRIDNKLFSLVAPGKDIVVKMGLNQAETMMKGEIACLEADFDETSLLSIRGYDAMYRMRFGTKRRSFKKIKDSSLARQLASGAGLGAEVDDTKVQHPFLWQNNQSDYEFLLERAERLDYEFLVSDGKLLFFSPKENARPEMTLTFRRDLIDFHAKMKTLTQGGEVNVRAPGFRRNQTIDSTARSGDERLQPSRGQGKKNRGAEKTGFKLSTDGFQDSAITVMDEPLVSSQDAELLARAKYNRILKNYITGEGTTPGNPRIRAGKTIKLDALGDKFSGVYYITSSTHIFRGDTYKTTFKVRRANI